MQDLLVAPCVGAVPCAGHRVAVEEWFGFPLPVFAVLAPCEDGVADARVAAGVSQLLGGHAGFGIEVVAQDLDETDEQSAAGNGASHAVELGFALFAGRVGLRPYHRPWLLPVHEVAACAHAWNAAGLAPPRFQLFGRRNEGHVALPQRVPVNGIDIVAVPQYWTGRAQ